MCRRQKAAKAKSELEQQARKRQEEEEKARADAEVCSVCICVHMHGCYALFCMLCVYKLTNNLFNLKSFFGFCFVPSNI